MVTLHDHCFQALLSNENGRRIEEQTFHTATLLAAMDRQFEKTMLFCERKLAHFRYKYLYAYSESSIDTLCQLTNDTDCLDNSLHFTFICRETEEPVISKGIYSGNIQKRMLLREVHLEQHALENVANLRRVPSPFAR